MENENIQDGSTDEITEPFHAYLHTMMPLVDELDHGAWNANREVNRVWYDNQYAIDYFTSGRGVYHLPDGEYQTGPERVFIIPPGVEYNIETDNEQPLRGFSLKFRLPNFQTAFLPMVLELDNAGANRIESLLRQAIGETVADSQDVMLSLSLRLLEILVFLTRTHRGSYQTPAQNAVVEMAMRFIDAHYTEDLELEDIAAAVGICREHLCRVFQENVKTSPFRLVRERRCEYARQRLINSREPMAQISEEAGFGNAQNMNRVFRSVYGQSPREYRRKMALGR